MAINPILSFKKTSVLPPRPQPSGGGPFKFPTYNRQAQRLAPGFSSLEKVIEAKNLQIQATPNSIVLEQVLVLRTVGSVTDFAKAVAAIQGMEWLGEFDEEDIPADEDFHKLSKKDKSRKDDPLSGRLYLLMSNHQAMVELLNIWKSFQSNPTKPLRTGLAGWKQVFKHLQEIRLWGVKDRFEDTGAMEDWQAQSDAGVDRIRFQLEPWFKKTSAERAQVTAKITELVAQDGGRIISQYALPEIAYQGFLAELPIGSVKAILQAPETHILHCEYIMFARPIAQGLVSVSDTSELTDVHEAPNSTLPQGPPRIALFDGLPIQNHALLKDRLTISDPDDFSADYQSKDRVHGTAMASAIIYGGLPRGEPISSKLYVRPIMKPGPADQNGNRRERIPEDFLELDLLHRAVVRLFTGPSGTIGEAPSVKVISYSIGDPVRQFDHFLSPVARLIDWLSWQYNVLFIISAGNHNSELSMACKKSDYGAKNAAEKQSLALEYLIDDSRNRRLLSPAESINALTVGASNSDGSNPQDVAHRFPVILDHLLPAPYSAWGLGYRRSIKPDLLVPGGRIYFTEKFDSKTDITLSPDIRSVAPGHHLAAPGSGTASQMSFHRGTSFAAGIACHYAERTMVALENLTKISSDISEEHFAVLIKAMLVHSASWGIARNTVLLLLKNKVKDRKQREFVSRLLGYGTSTFERILSCTDQRATLIACDSIASGQGQLFEIPLPTDLSGKKAWRRLTVTLAWFTPINPAQRPYRKAALWISNSGDDKIDKALKVDRLEADSKATMRGTVQHELLEGDSAVAFSDGTNIKIQVNCREDATTLVERIRYGLVVTLEVKEGLPIQVYHQIKNKIAARGRQAIRP